MLTPGSIRIEIDGAAIVEVDDGVITVSRPASQEPDWGEIRRILTPVPDAVA